MLQPSSKMYSSIDRSINQSSIIMIITLIIPLMIGEGLLPMSFECSSIRVRRGAVCLQYTPIITKAKRENIRKRDHIFRSERAIVSGPPQPPYLLALIHNPTKNDRFSEKLSPKTLPQICRPHNDS